MFLKINWTNALSPLTNHRKLIGSDNCQNAFNNFNKQLLFKSCTWSTNNKLLTAHRHSVLASIYGISMSSHPWHTKTVCSLKNSGTVFWFDCIYCFLATYLSALRYSIKCQIQAWTCLLYIFKSIHFMALNYVLFITKIYNKLNFNNYKNIRKFNGQRKLHMYSVQVMFVFSILWNGNSFWEPNHTVKA